MPVAACDGRAPMRYEFRGPRGGPLVVLLHGALNTAETCFKLLIPLLTDRGFRVLLYDRRGSGMNAGAGPWRGEWSAVYHEEDAQDLASILNSSQVLEEAPHPVALLGNSDGCPIALLAAAAAPRRVGAVVLCGGTHAWNGPRPAGSAAARANARRMAAAGFGGKEELRKLAERHGGDERGRAVLSRWLTWWVAGPAGEPPTSAGCGFDLRPRLRAVRCPVLGLHGVRDYDKEHDAAHLREVVRLLPHPAGAVHVFSDAGHTPQADCPERVARLTDSFLRTHCVPRDAARL